MDAPVSAFLQYLAGERGASPHTLRGYAADLTEFRRFLVARAVDGWEASTRARSAPTSRGCMAAELAKTSIARKLAAVRSCFRFLTRRGALAANPARHLRTPRLGRRLPSFLPKDESKDLLDAPEPAPRAGADRALLELLYAAGSAWRSAAASTSRMWTAGRNGPRARQGRGAHGAGGRDRAGRPRRLSRRPRRGGGAAVPQPARGAADHPERAPDRAARARRPASPGA